MWYIQNLSRGRRICTVFAIASQCVCTQVANLLFHLLRGVFEKSPVGLFGHPVDEDVSFDSLVQVTQLGAHAEGHVVDSESPLSVEIRVEQSNLHQTGKMH